MIYFLLLIPIYLIINHYLNLAKKEIEWYNHISSFKIDVDNYYNIENDVNDITVIKGNKLVDGVGPVTIAQFILHSNNTDEIKKIADACILKYKLDIKCLLYYDYNFESHNQIAPWHSPMAQGQMASAFLKIHRKTKNVKYLEIAIKLLDEIQENSEKLQFSIKTKNNGIWFNEYPGDDKLVLDGFLTTLAGYYDLYKYTKKKRFRGFLNKGIQCLEDNLTLFKKPFHGFYYHSKRGQLSFDYLNYNYALVCYLSEYHIFFKDMKKLFNKPTILQLMLSKIIDSLLFHFKLPFKKLI
jgi:hypothetical protein